MLLINNNPNSENKSIDKDNNQEQKLLNLNHDKSSMEKSTENKLSKDESSIDESLIDKSSINKSSKNKLLVDKTSINNKKSFQIAGSLTLILFFAILAMDYADQALLNPFLNTLLDDFFQNRDNVVPLGYVSFTFTILSAISMMIFGYLADQYSRKWICFSGTMLYSFFSLITFLIPHGESGYIFFFITRALNGIGIGAIVPSIYTLVNDSVKIEKRTTAFALLGVGALIGRMLGIVMAGTYVAQNINWREAYVLVGSINLVLGLALLTIREPERGSQDPELKNLIAEGNEYNFKFTKEDIKTLLRNKSNVWLILNFIDTIPGSLLLFLIFKYMEDIHNMKADLVNVMILSVAVFGAFGTVLFGWFGDKLYQKDKRGKVIVALFCNIFPIIFIVFFLKLDFWVPENATFSEAMALPGVKWLIVLITLSMFVNQGVGPNWMASVVEVNLPEHRASMIALANFADLLGNSLGPLIGAYISTYYGIQSAMWSIIGFWLLNVLFWIPVIINVRKDLQNVHLTLLKRASELEKKKFD